MILYLYGEDSYRRNQKCKELLTQYRIKHNEIDFRTFDFDEKEDAWKDAKDFLEQPSMFVDSKILLVREPQGTDEKEWIETLKKEIKTEKNFLILSDSKIPGKRFQFLEKPPAQVQEFDSLEGARLEMFVKKEANVHGLTFSPLAFQFFIRFLLEGTERSWRAVRELEKIKLAKFAQPIQKEDLEKFLSWRGETKLFLLGKRILTSQNVRQNLGILETALFQEESSYVFNTLGFQAVGNTALALADYDISVKSGKLEYEEALTGFILGEP